MAQQGGGHIVNVGSIAGVLRSPWASAYCASKAVVAGLAAKPRMLRLGGGIELMEQIAAQPDEQVDMMVSARFGLGAGFQPAPPSGTSSDE